MTNHPTARLVSVEAAAGALGIGRTQIFTLLRSGALDSVKIGARRLIPADALDELVARLRAEQHGDAPPP